MTSWFSDSPPAGADGRSGDGGDGERSDGSGPDGEPVGAAEDAGPRPPSAVELLRSGRHPSLRGRRDGWPTWARLAWAGMWVLIGAVLIVLPFLLEDLPLRRFASLLVLMLGVLGVVVATGHAGLITLGHGAFVGIGAFAMGGFLDFAGWPFWLSALASFVFCCGVGWLLGLPALRIRGIYLALVTLGVAVVFPSLAKRFGRLTGGQTGRNIETTMSPPSWTGLGDEWAITWRYYFCLIVCLVAFVATRNVLIGRMGRAMQAVRDDETSAATFGIELTRLKAGAFGLSAGLAGLAGALQVVLFPFVSHDQFGLFLSFRLYAAAVLGGVGHLIGAVWGVIALIVVPLLNGLAGRLRGDPGVGLLENDVIVFGIGLVALTFLSPNGVAGLFDRLGRRLERRN